MHTNIAHRMETETKILQLFFMPCINFRVILYLLTCIKCVGMVTMATPYALLSNALREWRNCARVMGGGGKGEEGSQLPPSSSQRGEPREWRAIRSTFL